MNDDKISYSEQEERQNADALNLAVCIESFLRKTKITPEEWIILDRLVKQLNKQRFKMSRKVLRSMSNKFETIQSRYQRG